MNWMKQFPRRRSSDDLVGVRLGFFADKPPRETKWDGMLQVNVMNLDSSEEYKVLMTDRDLENALTCFENDKEFTFTKKRGAEHASVEPKG